MRTYEEIKADVGHALSINDAEALLRGAEELEALGFPKALAESHSVRGTALRLHGSYPEALEHYHRALEMCTELGDRAGVALVTGNILSTLVSMERYAEAEALLLEMDTMQISDPRIVVVREVVRASLHEHHGQLEAAKAALIAGLEVADLHRIADSQAEAHRRLRDLAQKTNDFSAYIEHNNEYQRITEEIRGKEATQKMAMMGAERRIEAELRERDKERALLYGTLPKEAAERLIRGEVINDQFESAAVLFADIVGFTTHSSSMHPAEVTSFLEELYRRFDAICDEHGVTKVKTIGDSYLAFAGAQPAASTEQRAESSAMRIAAVALAMQQAEFYWPSATATDFSSASASTPDRSRRVSSVRSACSTTSGATP